MNRRDDSHLPHILRLRTDVRLAQLAGAFLAGGWLLAVTEAFAVGRVTTPALGLGAIGAALLLVGFLSAAITLPHRFGGADPGADPGGDDEGEDGGGGGGRSAPDPLPPSGGLEIDWDRFEQEFRAYATEAGAHRPQPIADLSSSA